MSHDSFWTVATGSLDPDSFFLGNVRFVEKENLKLSESIFNAIENCNGVVCNKHKQFQKSYKMVVSLTNLTAPFIFFYCL